MKRNTRCLIWLKGLPASGKSTYAKQLVLESGGSIKRVNKDDIRAMIDCGKWSREREKTVIDIQNSLIRQILEAGFSVVCDNTNFKESHLQTAKDMIANLNFSVDIEEVFFDVPLYECIRRDASRGDKSVGEKVIYRMYRQYCKKENPSNKDAKRGVIFDIDGTLAISKNRDPFEWDKVDTDLLNTPVYEIYQGIKTHGYKIIIFSGRDSVCRDKTEAWLKSYNIEYDYIDMRPAGNCEKDVIIKGRMFEKIKNDYNIQFVIDDRIDVVDYWRSIGLTVLQCDYGYF